MGKALQLPPATDANGAVLTDEQQDELLSQETLLEFDYTKPGENDAAPVVIARYAMIVDAANIKSGAFLAYQRKLAEIAKEAQDRGGQTAAQEVAATDEDDSFSAEQMLIVADYADLMSQMADAEAALLAPAIASWNVRWNSVAAPTTAEFLRLRVGPGSAAQRALKAWFFPLSQASEAATGDSATPNTPAT